jgi:gamma-glutamylcyclotransferase (GGCT)/AIG2-like uncharacterized protein YtfP
MSMRLFVYGTLRAGEENPFAALLRRSAVLLGRATIQGRLYAFGWHPSLVPSDDPADRVVGDVFEIRESEAESLIATLDEYEGPGFPRRQVEARLEDGRVVACWAYFYAGSVEGRERIASGEWRTHRERSG